MLGGDDGPATEVRAQDPVRLTGALERRGHRVERDGDVLHVLGATPARGRRDRRRTSGSRCSASHPRVRSLEDAFLALTGARA